MSATSAQTVRLGGYHVLKGQSSVSGLSSGAFMAVQLHLAHSASFMGAGIIAGGPYRCAESFRAAAPGADDAYVLTAEYICMNPITPQVAPRAADLARLAHATAADREIDSIANLADDRVYIFTGSRDKVVSADVVARTRDFYELLGVGPANVVYRDDVPAGHSMITDSPEDSALSTNQPPYINNGGFMLSHEILRHIYGPAVLNPPSDRLTGRLLRFDQTEFFDNQPRASMSRYGFAYVPLSVEQGAKARVHVALHGCKQGYNYTNFLNGRADIADQPPYGNRYFTTTGYNDLADSNDIIVLYPQVEGSDGGAMQNPDGCWDWWGYSAADLSRLDYYTKNAIQIRAIYRMLSRLGG